MNFRTSGAVVLAVCCLFSVRLSAQATPTSYAQMAPVAQYLMPRADEIALARSAAPSSISDHATVLALTPQGYDTAAAGTNGFVCFVERSWDSPFHVPKFWNPNIRGANCLNPPAARSVLPLLLLRTKLALSLRSQDGILAGIKEAVAAHQVPDLEPNAVSFMLSKHSYLTNSGGNLAHVMFFVPDVAPAEWGADLKGSPISLAGKFDVAPIDIYIVAVPTWSDGSSATGTH